MSLKSKRKQTCPACHEQKAISTQMRPHLERHCAVVRILRQRCYAGEITAEQVNQQVQDYIATYQATKPRRCLEVCDCVVRGSHFCERVVELIDWDNELVHFRVGRRFFVRFVSREAPHSTMDVLDRDFNSCKGGHAALQRMRSYWSADKAAVLPDSVLQNRVESLAAPARRRPVRSSAQPLPRRSTTHLEVEEGSLTLAGLAHRF
jgi:hypothetical protein